MAFGRPIPIEEWKQGSQNFQNMIKEFGAKGLDFSIIKQMAGDHIDIKEQMAFEGNRLLSFKTWPSNANANPTLLAKAGFYYSGNSDEVICFVCEGKIRNWQKDANPNLEHIKQYSDCPFTCGSIGGINLKPPDPTDPNIDDPTISCVKKYLSLKKQLDEVDQKIRETNRMILRRHLSYKSSDRRMIPWVTASTKYPGEVMIRSARIHHIGVSRSITDFRDEDARIKSFEGFWAATSPVTPSSLAEAGLFYCGPDDMVMCPWCYGMLKSWEKGDDPLKEHKHHFKDCPKFGERKTITASSLVNIHNMQGDAGIKKLGEDDLGIVIDEPCTPKFAIEDLRLKSFEDGEWSNHTQNPEQLSSAGFFHTGYADEVTCFFCDGTIRLWQKDEDPWTEHARWFPKCGFLKQAKGATFIEKVRELGANGGPLMGDDDDENRSASHDRVALRASPSSRRLTKKQKREVIAAMRSPLVVNALLKRGISKEAIENAIEERMLAGNCHFRGAESLLEAASLVFDATPDDAAYVTKLIGLLLGAESAFAVAQPPPDEGPSKSKKHRTEELEGEVSNKDDISSNGVDVKSLIEENSKLKEQRLCKICMNKEVSIVLLPCGHLVSCMKCVNALKQKCPICRKAIKGSVRTFMA